LKPKEIELKKKVSNFEDHAENFYSDKTVHLGTVHFFNMGLHETYSVIDTLQRNRALFLIFVKK
jgi:hypothetical protein